jgi:hypothetical protein
MLQDVHRNSQAVSIIEGSLSAEEYRRLKEERMVMLFGASKRCLMKVILRQRGI